MTRAEIEAALAECEGHTPGPWEKHCLKIWSGVLYIADAAKDVLIAESKANARLIALAPDLAAALREAWAEIDRLKKQYARIVVQTKRFEEGNCPICGYNGPGYFQPDKHPCAKYYHEAGINPSLDQALNEGDGTYKP